MDRMMETLGVDPIAIRRDSATSWFQARTRCIECANVDECRRWLASPNCDEADQAPEFCPNRLLFNTSRDSDEWFV
jgi:Family of unknown function (DUF6455)